MTRHQDKYGIEMILQNNHKHIISQTERLNESINAITVASKEHPSN